MYQIKAGERSFVLEKFKTSSLHREVEFTPERMWGFTAISIGSSIKYQVTSIKTDVPGVPIDQYAVSLGAKTLIPSFSMLKVLLLIKLPQILILDT